VTDGAAVGVAPIRVLIADDYVLLRDGLRRLIEEEHGFSVAGEAVDGLEAVRLARELLPDVLLLDVGMPRASGMEVLRQLSADDVFPRTLLLTGDLEASQLAEAIELGARGWIPKDTAAVHLFKAIRAVVAGEYWLGRGVVSRLLDHAKREAAGAGASPASPLDRLTEREREIVEAMALGESNRLVAERLQMAEQTVKHHLTRIFEKLGVSSRAELVAALGRGSLTHHDGSDQLP
jgi:two-component system nitrate/nitrite response regulator NarL